MYYLYVCSHKFLMLNMGRCFAWFFESRSYLAHLGSIIVLVVNSFFVIYLHVNDPNKDYNNNKVKCVTTLLDSVIS